MMDEVKAHEAIELAERKKKVETAQTSVTWSPYYWKPIHLTTKRDRQRGISEMLKRK